jgi:hypothetical protein
MKNTAFLIGILGMASGFAAEYNASTVDDRLAALEKKVFDAPIRSREYGFNAWGEFLWWRGNLSLPYAVSHTLTTAFDLDTNQKIRNVRMGYDPGFRLGIGYETRHDQWDTALIWTCFNQEGKNSVRKTDIMDIHAVWESSQPPGTINSAVAKATLHLHLQTLDYVLGKSFLWSQPFRFRYFMGIKGATLRVRDHILYDGTSVPDNFPLTEHVKVANYFRGLGLTNGLETFWNIKGGWGFFGRAELAALWGRFITKQRDRFESPNTSGLHTPFTLKNRNKLYDVKLNFICALGLFWKREFCKKKALLTLSAGYEFNYWPNQILLNNFLEVQQNDQGGSALLFQQPSDIGFQGYDVRARLDF